LYIGKRSNKYNYPTPRSYVYGDYWRKINILPERAWMSCSQQTQDTYSQKIKATFTVSMEEFSVCGALAIL
jgi:hypothetical protein